MATHLSDDQAPAHRITPAIRRPRLVDDRQSSDPPVAPDADSLSDQPDRVEPAAETSDATRRRTGYQGTQPSVQIGGVDRPSYRELDTDGIPIQRRQGTVAAIHSRAKSRVRPRRELAPLAESGPAAPPAGAPPPPETASPVEGAELVQPRHAAHYAPAQPADDQPSGTRPVSPDSFSGTSPIEAPYAGRRDAPLTHPNRPGTMVEREAPRSATPARLPDAGGADSAALMAAGRDIQQPLRRETTVPAPARPSPSHWERSVPSRRVTPPSPALQADIQEWRAVWRAAVMADTPERRCATCRDFRPSDTPERGWCVNQWAFGGRQVVPADGLACLSAIGSWWVGSDQAVRAKASVTSSSTPMADGLLQLLNEAQSNRRWS